MPPGGMPPPSPFTNFPGQAASAEQLIPTEVCRRAAWRLATLADAILAADGQRGLVKLPDADSPEARELSQKLRRAAMELDAEPYDAIVVQALTDLRPPVAARDQDEPAAAVEEEPKPAAPK